MNGYFLRQYMPVIALLVLFSLPLRAGGAAEWVVYNTANSALPDNQVQALATGPSHTVWIGTADGLARLSNSGWTVYTDHLPSSFITSLAVDAQGTLWAGTDRGLASYNGTIWTVYDSTVIPGNLAITALLCDMATGILWAGSEKGLLRFDGATWTRYDDSNSALIDDFICSVAADSSGTLWVGTFDHFKFLGRLWNFNGSTWHNTRLDLQGLPSSFPEALAVDRYNTLWLGTRGTTGGTLVRISDKWEIFNAATTPWLHGGISSVAPEDTTLWLGSGNGLVRYNGESWTGFDASTSGLPDNYVSSVAVDSQGNTWIGTISGGVAIYKTGGVATSVDDSKPADGHARVWPAPVAHSATVSWQIPVAGHTTVRIYDGTGTSVATLFDGYMQSGNHTALWQPGNLPDGLYFCRVIWNGGQASLAVPLLR